MGNQRVWIWSGIRGSRSLLLEPDIDHAAIVWRETAGGWKKSVKKAYPYDVMQESVAADVRGWHHIILPDIKRFGGEVEGYDNRQDAGTYQCHWQPISDWCTLTTHAALYVRSGCGLRTKSGFTWPAFRKIQDPIYVSDVVDMPGQEELLDDDGSLLLPSSGSGGISPRSCTRDRAFAPTTATTTRTVSGSSSETSSERCGLPLSPKGKDLLTFSHCL